MRPATDGRGRRDTSRDGFAAVQPKLSRQQRTILAYLATHHAGATRSEIADATGERLSSVCGRVNELLALYVLEDAPRRRCSITGSAAHVVRMAAYQTELFA